MTTSKRAATRRGKVRKEFWLDPRLLKRAQSVLGTSSERETVEVALDLATFSADVRAGVDALAGLKLDERS